MCVQYWPDPGMTLTYGMCIVENISEDHPRQEYLKRNFRIALTSNVRHLYNNHYMNACFSCKDYILQCGSESIAFLLTAVF